MSEMATYIGAEPRTKIPTAVALARGVRVTENSSGLVAVAAAAARGQFVTLTACAASEPVAVHPMQAGNKVPALASEACAVGDPAYAAASGKFSKTSTSAVYVGQWTQAAAGDGSLGEVELANVLPTV